MKKTYSCLLTLVAFTAPLAAADDTTARDMDRRITALEQRRAAGGMINPPASPVVREGVNLWVQLEALYMRPTESNLEIAVKTPSSQTWVDGPVKNATYDWDWGFRLGLGYNLQHDGWSTLLAWTRFHTEHDKHLAARSGKQYDPSDNSPNTSLTTATEAANAAHGHLDLDLDILDLELGKEFFVSRWLTVRPYIGLRNVWAYRDFDVHYNHVPPTGPGKLTDLMHNHYIGLGPRLGLDTQWGLGCGWSIYGEAAVSALYGRQKLHSKEYSKSAPGVPSVEQEKVRNIWMEVKAMADLSLGFRWDHLFSNDDYRIRLQLGWEEHLLLDYTKDMRFTTAASKGKFAMSSGALGLSGPSLMARLDF